MTRFSYCVFLLIGFCALKGFSSQEAAEPTGYQASTTEEVEHDAADSEDGIVVRTSITPKASAFCGERVVLRVDVLGKDAWARLPKIPHVSVAGAIVFVPPNQNLRLNDSIKGSTYTGQRYEWWIYPQRAGPLTIPPIELSVERKTFGSTLEPASEARLSSAQTLTISRPPNASNDGIAATAEMTVTQSWSDQPTTIKAGDGLVRTIERSIRDAPSLVLAPIRFTAPPGVQVFEKTPTTENRIHRGDLTGTRSDIATFVFQNPGKAQLPPIEIIWYDTEAQQIRSKTLEGLSLAVEPSADSLTENVLDGSSSPSSMWRASALAFAILSLVGCVTWCCRRNIQEWRTTRMEHRRQSEPLKFHRFVDAARSGHPAQILRELTAWSDCVQNRSAAPRLDQLFGSIGSETASQQLDSLQKAVDSGQTHIDASPLLANARIVRDQVRSLHRRSHQEREATLPPLRSH
ncbi:MAG: BatD family protein [Planctomycetota bacterium]